MFTRINLKNFKSFKDVSIDLSSKKNESKKLAIIYGVNGSGKTTITQAFLLLKRTIETMEVRGVLNDLLDEKIVPPEDFPFKQDVMLQMLKTRLSMNGIETIIHNYKMVDTAENMSVEYQFVINGNPGSYYIEMDDTSIVKERLEFKLSKRRGCYFNIEDDEININSKIFETKEFYDLINKQTKMYWGKHSLLSILLFEMADKADTFINSNISNNLMDVLLHLSSLDFKFVSGKEGGQGDSILENLQLGSVDKSEEKRLKEVEQILDSIFKSIFKDVEKVFYQKHLDGEKIAYRLYLRKKIEDKSFDIDFSLESSGTKEILRLIPSFVSAASGKCVIVDEYGTRIHDVLSAKLLEAVAEQISGQLIMTTHNTMIMECRNLSAESLYFILDDKTFKKSVKCVTEIEERLHPNYNYRTRYLTNELYQESLPDVVGKVDLSGLVKLFK
ncbi:MAG: AAA family ATPase [Eubacteriales bacterium]|nr:AAA family ATPase [Eubacteriales bacterium]